MRVKKLTRRQQDVLQALDDIRATGMPPTLASMAWRLDMTPGGVRNHLVRLRAMGVVEWEAGKAGTVRRVAKGPAKGIWVAGEVS